MQVRLGELDARLASQLAPAYFVSGDEVLLVQEACDAIVAEAERQGFSERSVQYVETGFRWDDILQDAASMSLFAERRIIDVRAPANKFDRVASETLRSYADAPSDDILLLIRTGRLDAKQRSTAWFKALDKLGVMVLIWPVDSVELPKWLGGRLRAAGLQLAPEAVTYLCEQVEGNLLAAVQEIEKLKLANLEQPISAEALMQVMEDSAHYDAFELIDAV
ncbi:MAG: DNA polymerase III subunit delta, partial [Gammaproteobacteria bacterium]|nr:DNA polymerase III subunit delta [Gammaproteobacteria bacterium]